jgi:hypothetical protein
LTANALVGLDREKARRIADAARAAAVDEAFDTIAGDGPLPTSPLDVRALRLSRIPIALGETLRPREVEIILRLDPSAAAADRRMRATYAASIEAFLHAPPP